MNSTKWFKECIQLVLAKLRIKSLEVRICMYSYKEPEAKRQVLTTISEFCLNKESITRPKLS